MNDEATLKIGLIAPPWVSVPPVGYGGSELMIDQLARALSAKGHEVTLFATGDSTCPVKVESVVDVAPGVHVGSSLVEMRQVIEGYRAFAGFDIVHDHTTIGPVYARSEIAGPIVTTNHNLFVEPYLSVYRSQPNQIPVVAVSHAHARSAAEVSIETVGVIHHGIDLDDYPFGEDADDFALVLGRMSPDKGIAEAITIARAAGIELRIGAKMADAMEVAYFDSAVRPHLGDDCVYLGELNQREKREQLVRARCLLNPITWNEPFGLAMIEAMACGTPVIARQRGAVPEIIGSRDVGLTGESDADLVACFARIGAIDRSTCRSHVGAHFSADQMADAHLDLYRKIIREAKSPVVSPR